jgi:mono/diheme cytochrome c family protein
MPGKRCTAVKTAGRVPAVFHVRALFLMTRQTKEKIMQVERQCVVATRGLIAAALLLFTACGIAAEDNPEAVKNPYEGREELVAEGASLFNQYCSHCHGPNAVQGERPRDLRRLRIRYGENAISLFWATINNGRMDKGMPVWKDAISDDIKWRIFTFLQSVQSQR